jgi:Spondin_N
MTIALLVVLAGSVAQVTLAQTSAYTVVSSHPSNIPSTVQAKYSCDFLNLWTPERHSYEYPIDTARWSPPVMVAHNDSFTLWNAQEYMRDSLKYLAAVRRCIGMRCVCVGTNFLPKLTLTFTVLAERRSRAAGKISQGQPTGRWHSFHR